MKKFNKFETTGLFFTKEAVASVLPFFFNEENSDITVEPFIDGEISVTCEFGSGKGWDTLGQSIKEAVAISDDWGKYTMGYIV